MVLSNSRNSQNRYPKEISRRVPALVGDESRVLLSRRVPRWLQVTIRFLEIDDEDAHGDVGPKREGGRGESPRSLGSSRFCVRFRGVSARYTSFNRIRMQCCGKFHLSEARGSEAGGTGGTQRAGLGGVDPAVTLSRLYGPPAELFVRRVPAATHTTFAYPLLAFAFAIAASNASR